MHLKAIANAKDNQLDFNCNWQPLCKNNKYPVIYDVNGDSKQLADPETGLVDGRVIHSFLPTTDEIGNPVEAECVMTNTGAYKEGDGVQQQCLKEKADKDAAYLKANHYIGGMIAGLLTSFVFTPIATICALKKVN